MIYYSFVRKLFSPAVHATNWREVLPRIYRAASTPDMALSIGGATCLRTIIIKDDEVSITDFGDRLIEMTDFAHKAALQLAEKLNDKPTIKWLEEYPLRVVPVGLTDYLRISLDNSECHGESTESYSFRTAALWCLVYFSGAYQSAETGCSVASAIWSAFNALPELRIEFNKLIYGIVEER